MANSKEISRLEIISPNLILNKCFRDHLTKAGASNSCDETQEVARYAIEHFQVQEIENDCEIMYNPKDNFKTELKREQLEVKAKLFIRETGVDPMIRALEAIEKNLDTSYIDSLQLSVPINSLKSLAIAEEEKPKDDLYFQHFNKLCNLWSVLEDRVDKKNLYSIGICDVDTHTLKLICERSKFKPNSINVNLASCCVVPPELQEFSKQNKIKLQTHNDSGDIFPEEKLSLIKFPNLVEPKLEYVVRYQVMESNRGVLLDKRYILGFCKGAN